MNIEPSIKMSLFEPAIFGDLKTAAAAKKAATQENIKKATAYYNENAKPGSLASKANMVKKFEEKNDRK